MEHLACRGTICKYMITMHSYTGLLFILWGLHRAGGQHYEIQHELFELIVAIF